jgi:pimeloyl-ACP methyl ester carboxylesterase
VGPARFDARFRHDTATVHGVRYHFVRGGTRAAGRAVKPTVVLLHGFPETWYEWHRVLPLLVDAGYAVLAPDLRGMGDTGRPAAGAAGAYDAATVADDLRALVRRLGLGPVDVVAHDIAGDAAYAYAARHPREVRRLALVETLAGGVPVDVTGNAVVPGIWHPQFHQTAGLPEALIAGRERAYLAWFFTHYAARGPAVAGEELDVYVRALEAPGALAAALAHYRAQPENARRNAGYARTPLPMPTLGVGGATVLGALPGRQARALARDGRGAVLAGCGHWLPTLGDCRVRTHGACVTGFPWGAGYARARSPAGRALRGCGPARPGNWLYCLSLVEAVLSGAADAARGGLPYTGGSHA